MNKEFWLGVIGGLAANGLYLRLVLPVDSTCLYVMCLPLNIGLVLLALIRLGRAEAVRGVLWAIFLSLWLGGFCLMLFLWGGATLI